MLLPVIEFTNHDGDCPHTHTREPCDPDKGLEQWRLDLPKPSVPPTLGAGFPVGGFSSSSSGGNGKACGDGGSDAGSCADSGDAADSGGASGVCITFRAGAPLTAGSEVCNFYTALTNDRSAVVFMCVCCRMSCQRVLAC